MIIPIAIVAYLAAQIAIGIWVSRRIHTESDYLIAGRQLGYSLTTFSLFATWFGAETIISGAGSAYESGFSFSSPEPFGYGLCLVGMGLIFAAPLWKRELTTLADLFRKRYSVRTERIAAIILIPSSVLWAAAQIRAFGHIVSTVTPSLSADGAMFAAACFTVVYTAFGGLLTDAITDVIQGIVVILGLVAMAIAVFFAIDGMTGVQVAISEISLESAFSGSGSWLSSAEAWAIPICGSIVATELVGRVVGAKSALVAKRSSLIAGGIYISVGLLPLFIGLTAGGLVSGLADSEQVIPEVAKQVLPGALYVLFAGALISAILSTVDSTLLVASGLLSHNLIIPVFKVSSETMRLRLARCGVLAFGIIAWLLAISAENVFSLVEQASAFGSAGVLITVSFGLFTNRGGSLAAQATLITGISTYVAGTVAAVQTPFLMALLASLLMYLTVAALETKLIKA